VLTVLHIAYPLAPVSLDATGGAEQILALLDRGLQARGHQSIVVSCEGSRTAGRLLSIAVKPPFGELSRRRARAAVHTRTEEALARWNIDVVHMHGVDFHEYLPPEPALMLATLHLPASYYPDEIFRIARPGTYLNCVSNAQHRTCPSSEILLEPISNGVPLELFCQPRRRKEGFALVLGRICPEKGFHLALDAADQARMPLLIGGSVFAYEEHREYFRREIMPRLRPPHRFLGPLNFAAKRDLLMRASCVVVPSLVAETSSLVTMESLACGTPVVAFANGAPAEMIEHGRTGFLVRDTAEMADAMVRCGELDGAECRRVAQERFSAEIMTEQYIERYHQLAARIRPAVCASEAH
jgi:glycosyltransferase involved in cell wall biosynthesis